MFSKASNHSSPDLGDGGAVGLGFSLRLALFFTAFFAAGVFALFALAYFLIKDAVHDQELETVRYRVDEYRAWFAEGGLGALEARFAAQSNQIPEVMFLRIVAGNGDVNYFSNPRGTSMLQLSDLRRLPTRPIEGNFRFGEKEPHTWSVVSEQLGAGLVIQAGKSSEAGEIVLRHFRRIIGTATVPVLLLGLVGSVFVGFRAMAPIRRLIFTIQEILRTGDLRQRVEPKRGSNELNALVELFNRLLAKNQRLIDAMHHSLDSVGHDLRTPMTRLRATVEQALTRDDGTAEDREALIDCLEESDEVLQMLDHLMELSEAASGTMRLDLGKVWIAELFKTIADLYEFVAEERGVVLSFDAPEEIVITGDRRRLQRLMANLVDNALKYSPENSKITITARELADLDEVYLVVRDEGAGIPASEQGRIWDRLYRGDQSRSRRGLGLGLSFVKAIAEAHGGRAEVESVPGRGSEFRIWLKKQPE
jgi:signal transduction histidine kinase